MTAVRSCFLSFLKIKCHYVQNGFSYHEIIFSDKAPNRIQARRQTAISVACARLQEKSVASVTCLRECLALLQLTHHRSGKEEVGATCRTQLSGGRGVSSNFKFQTKGHAHLAPTRSLLVAITDLVGSFTDGQVLLNIPAVPAESRWASRLTPAGRCLSPAGAKHSIKKSLKLHSLLG